LLGQNRNTQDKNLNYESVGQNYYFSEALKIASDFWTSGTNAGESCDAQKVYTWCSTQKNLPTSLIDNNSVAFWAEKQWPPLLTSDARCLALTFLPNSAEVRHKSCSLSLPCFCEVKI